MNPALPNTIADERQLDDLLSHPNEGVTNVFLRVPGDVLILGAGGKMGPSLALMAARALRGTAVQRRIIAVSRFSNKQLVTTLRAAGIEVIRCDLLADGALEALPYAQHVIYMTGMKFGASDDPARTWAMNCLLPAAVARRYRNSHIAAFSTGNIYGPVSVKSAGSKETDDLNPQGEYAMSSLGRERLLSYTCTQYGTPLSIIRLNYACEMRYGVLVDIGRKVWREEPVDVTMGHVNVIWQADANAVALQALGEAAAPPFVINVTGPEKLKVRDIAKAFGKKMSKKPAFTGKEAPEALLNDASAAHQRWGTPHVSAKQLIEWTADWIMNDRVIWDKPTHFEVRSGKF
ncbi:MAG: NAD-dependent epimerase/dehydratase family protein [Candidatus Hydrogenedentota bacterium]